MNAVKKKLMQISLDDCSKWTTRNYTFEIERRVLKTTKLRLMREFVKRFWLTDIVQCGLQQDGLYDAFVLSGESVTGIQTLCIGINDNVRKNQDEYWAIENEYLKIPNRIRRRTPS